MIKKNIDYWKLIDITAMICGLFFLLYRASLAPIYWDGGLTDEAWYIAEPYLVSKGAIPYVNLWSQSSGFTVPLAILDYIFFRNSTEGIVLFHKYFTIVWFGLMNLLAIKILREKDIPIPYMFCFPLILLYPHQMIEINYNTIGLHYTLLIYALLYPKEEILPKSQRVGLICAFFAGALMARTVLGTPFAACACLCFAFFLLVRKEIKRLFFYIIGGILYVTVLLAWMCACTGFDWQKIRTGIYLCFAEMLYLKLDQLPLDVKLTWLGKFMIPFVFIVVANVIIFIVFKVNEEKIRNKIILYELFILCTGSIVGLIQYNGYSSELNYINQFGWFGIFICVLYNSQDTEFKEVTRNFIWLVLAYFTTYMLAGYLSIDGYETRAYWLFIPTLLMFFFSYMISNSLGIGWSKQFSKPVIYILFILVGGLLILGSQKYLYRLDRGDYGVIIQNGIWKGCRINEDDAKAVVELENKIRTITSKEDDVLILDYAAFGYLMTDAKACTPNTAYGSSFHLHVEDSQIQYNYCALEGKVPSKIIYIDYGLDGIASIEYQSWQFNQYVNSFYEKKSHYKNSLFRVMEYDIIDENGAMEYVDVTSDSYLKGS